MLLRNMPGCHAAGCHSRDGPWLQSLEYWPDVPIFQWEAIGFKSKVCINVPFNISSSNAKGWTKDFSDVCCTKGLYQGGNPDPPLPSRKPMKPAWRAFHNQEYLNSEEQLILFHQSCFTGSNFPPAVQYLSRVLQLIKAWWLPWTQQTSSSWQVP